MATRSCTRIRRSSTSATRSTAAQLIALSSPRASSTASASEGSVTSSSSAARQHGYRLDTSRLHQSPDDVGTFVRFRIDPNGQQVPAISASYKGFECPLRRR